MVREFDMFGDCDSEPVLSVFDFPLEALLHVPNFNNVVEQELISVGRDSYQMAVPRLVASVTLGFDSSSIFFTDGSKGGWVQVLVYIILVIPIPVFILENQVECILQRFLSL
jgi:hypothetical protein